MYVLLFLQKNTSLYYSYDQYAQIDPDIISEENEDWEQTLAQVEDSMETYENVAPPEYGLPYTLSNDINEILQVSENIYEIEIADIYAESKRTPATVYYCNVLKTLRGAPASEGMIMITFFNDTVIEGERYVVLLSTDEAAPIYLLSSMNSVYTPKQVEEIPELSELMISAKDYTSEHTIHRQSLPQRGAKVTDKIPF